MIDGRAEDDSEEDIMHTINRRNFVRAGAAAALSLGTVSAGSAGQTATPCCVNAASSAEFAASWAAIATAKRAPAA